MKKGILSGLILLCILTFNTEIISAQQNDKGCAEFEAKSAIGDSLYEAGNYKESASCYLLAIAAEKNTKTPNPRALAKSYGNAGFSFDMANEPEEAIRNYQSGLAIARKSNDSVELAIQLANMGQSYTIRGDYEQALRFMKEALLIERCLKNEEGISINLNAIGKIFESWNHPQDAIRFYEQALEIDRKANALSRIAIRLSSLGSVYLSLKDYTKALQYQQQALEIEKQLNNPKKIGVRLDRIGEIYLETSRFPLAEKNFREALAIFRADSNLSSTAKVLLHLGKSHLRQGRFPQSLEAYTESLEIAEQLHIHQIKLDVLYELSELFSLTKKPEKALNFLHQYIALKDSVFNEESQKQIMEFRTKFQTERKEKEIVMLTAEKEINALQLKKNRQQKGFLIGSAILLSLVILLIFSRYRIKQKNNILLEEKNNELRILNATKDRFFAIIAHDMKNPVSAFRNISGSLMKHFEHMKAEDLRYYITELNRTAGNVNDLLQNLLEWARSQLNNISVDIQEHSLSDIVNDALRSIEQTATEKNIGISVLIASGSTVKTDRNILTTVLRNLLSNGVKFTPQDGLIEIGASTSGSIQEIWVSDSGPGIKESDISNLFRIDVDVRTINPGPEKGSGLGLILCHELIAKTGGKLTVESSVGIGSKFFISLSL